MIALPEFTLARPTSLREAERLAAEPNARLIAGGTGLVPNLRLGLGSPQTLVSLERIDELQTVHFSDHVVRIGAGVTLDRLAGLEGIPDALRQAAKAVAAPGHRAAATLGGNLCLDTRCVYYNQSEQWRRANGYCLKYGGDTCHVAPQGKKCRAAYSGDLAPALLVLGAHVEVRGSLRPLQSLYNDDGAEYLTLTPGEIICAVHLPARSGRSGYSKLRSRGSLDYPLAGVAMFLDLENRNIRELRVALTGTNSRPVLLEGTEALVGAQPDEASAAALAKLVQKQAGPMRTTLAAADYRRQGAAILARRLLARLTQEQGGAS